MRINMDLWSFQKKTKPNIEASKFMDDNELNTLIDKARTSTGLSKRAILDALNEAGGAFKQAAKEKFSGEGEW